MLPEKADVLIIGAGPAGLSAALELKRLGVKDIIVFDREAEAGGTPRLCDHIGFGLRDLHRLLTGPAYSRRYTELAKDRQINVVTSTTITGWLDSHRLAFTSPQGLGVIEAKAILLATGARERPRAARLIPGTRPAGVFTTGSLQRFVHEHHLPVGKRAVIVGAELISLSVVLTLMKAKVRVVKLITELPRHQVYFPYTPAKWLFADILARAPIETHLRVVQILGNRRVDGIEIAHMDSGESQIVECDTVVFTGDWIPEHELARTGHIAIDTASNGPQVDALFRTSQHGVFAAGNLLRGVETADFAALEGKNAAAGMCQYLETKQWRTRALTLQTEHPLSWIVPNVLTPEADTNNFRFEAFEFKENVHVQVWQGERLLHSQRFGRLVANCPMNLNSSWVSQVDYQAGNIRLTVASPNTKN